MNLAQRVKDNPVVFFLGALATGFVAGIGAYDATLRIARLDVVNETRLADYEMLRTKDRFLSLSLRWALISLPPFRFEHSDEERRAAQDALDAYMLEYIEAADKSESIVAVGKGQGTQATISFPDGSQWAVPPAFRAATGD
jgi:hypothetical protein